VSVRFWWLEGMRNCWMIHLKHYPLRFCGAEWIWLISLSRTRRAKTVLRSAQLKWALVWQWIHCVPGLVQDYLDIHRFNILHLRAYLTTFQEVNSTTKTIATCLAIYKLLYATCWKKATIATCWNNQLQLKFVTVINLVTWRNKQCKHILISAWQQPCCYNMFADL
jgi:hypothetical protein